ncbi:hypothetical protein GPECTOR_124g490 [Gonium pectorale]|uniref:EML-like second beta-propeller domain-containing protein n=1 Tax=Gonium pectorale TaxID=33097 RepID=A0A150G046_GONPE|nr:hypothetical protein GPECTOR_124g490 [Gonium pectorale]|eukprot:KXZ42690.1 hypothetical protein GPECTOR_124g490 [Gonium pectorale]
MAVQGARCNAAGAPVRLLARNLAEGRFAGPPLSLRSAIPDRGHCIRAIDYDSARGVVLDVLVYGHCDDVWCVAFHPTRPARAATASERLVYLWDTASRSLERSALVGFAARAVAFSARPLEGDGATHHIAVGGAKGDIMVLLESTLQPVHRCRDSREGVTDIKYSPDGRLMAAATADTWIDIYAASRGYQRIQRCTGHSSTIRGIDWSTDGSILQSDSADLELLVWNARTGKQIPIPSRDTRFHTYTVRLGFPVMGIWPDGSDGTDVNAVCRSARGDLVATCDDDGLVKLFNCPAVLDDAPHRAYRGHSSHVMCVRFSADDSTLLSVGGYDWGMFQFAVVELTPMDHGPHLPQKVWGALDPEGRAFGWTFSPYDVQQPGGAGQQGGPGSEAGPSRGPSREPSSYGPPGAGSASAAAGDWGAAAVMAPPPPEGPPPSHALMPAAAGGSGGGYGELAGNAAPTRMYVSAGDDELGEGAEEAGERYPDLGPAGGDYGDGDDEY